MSDMSPDCLMSGRCMARLMLMTGSFCMTFAAAAQEPSPAPAASAAPETEMMVITIYGDRLNRELSETTTSTALATKEDLKESSAAATKDVVSSFANVVSASGDREIAIRGVLQSGIGGEGETISVYLDGVALPQQAARFAGPLSTWDLERVEVLRGAQSTQQGRNSLAGSVILRSQEPTSYWDAQARAGVMSRDGHDYAIAGGGPITDTLRFRVSAQDRYDRGDITNLTRKEDDAGREIARNLKARALWQPEGMSGYLLRYGYTQSKNEFGDPLHDSSMGERTETSNVRGNEDDVTRLHSVEQGIDVGNYWRVESVSGWTKIRNLYTIDFDRSAAAGGYSDNTLDEKILSQELRARYTQGSLRAVFGGYYADAEKATSTLGYDVAAGGGLVLLNGFIDSDSTVRTQALFGEADWDFAEDWRATAGLRWNEERSQRNDASDLNLTITAPVPGLPAGVVPGVPLPDALSDLIVAANPGLVPPDYTASGNERFRDFLPKLGITWMTGESSSLSLTYAEGYRSGGTSVSFFGGAVSPFKPETTKTLELAARSRWLDEKLMLNANVFYTKWRDQQVTIGETSGFETTTENAGKSHYFGLETEAVWTLDTPFDLFLNAGLLKSEFDEFMNNGEDYAGNQFPYAPRHTANLGLRLRPWKRLSGQFNAQHIGAFFSDPDNDPRSRADARLLLNARLAIALPQGFSLAIYGRNLTDDTNEQGALVAGTRLATRYGEARSAGVLLEWQL